MSNIENLEEIMKYFDLEVIALVLYFNEKGLTTSMSCSGSNRLHYDQCMTMFWIEFDESVTEQDIIDFQLAHSYPLGGFCAEGRFNQRILSDINPSDPNMCIVDKTYYYEAASVEAAYRDLGHWIILDAMYKTPEKIIKSIEDYLNDYNKDHYNEDEEDG